MITSRRAATRTTNLTLVAPATKTGTRIGQINPLAPNSSLWRDRRIVRERVNRGARINLNSPKILPTPSIKYNRISNHSSRLGNSKHFSLEMLIIRLIYFSPPIRASFTLVRPNNTTSSSRRSRATPMSSILSRKLCRITLGSPSQALGASSTFLHSNTPSTYRISLTRLWHRIIWDRCNTALCRSRWWTHRLSIARQTCPVTRLACRVETIWVSLAPPQPIIALTQLKSTIASVVQPIKISIIVLWWDTHLSSIRSLRLGWLLQTLFQGIFRGPNRYHNPFRLPTRTALLCALQAMGSITIAIITAYLSQPNLERLLCQSREMILKNRHSIILRMVI